MSQILQCCQRQRNWTTNDYTHSTLEFIDYTNSGDNNALPHDTEWLYVTIVHPKRQINAALEKTW